MKGKSILFLVSILLFFSFSNAQSPPGTGPKEPSFRQSVRTKKQRRKESRARRKLEKEERKAVKKHHKRIQTKAVRKRMKSSRKQALRNHDHKREFFVSRWFKKKVRHKKFKAKTGSTN